ncbi:MAG: tetratricopeptide repeat protein [bacterium]
MNSKINQDAGSASGFFYGLAATAALSCFFCAVCQASLPESPANSTVWDRIMQEQAYKNMRRGAALLEAGYYTEAVRDLSLALIERPGDPWTHIMYGTALYWAGSVDQAIQEFAEAMRLDPANAQAHQLMAIAHAWKGDAEKALEEFLEAEKRDPERSDVQMDLGSVYQAFGKTDMALEKFRKAVNLEPENPLYHFQLGSLYVRLGRDADAVESFGLALRHFSRYEDAMLELAATMERTGQTKEAVKLYRRALKLKPGDSVARFRLALVLLKEGDSAGARETLMEAFRLTPAKGDSGIGLSMSYSGRGNSAIVPGKKNAAVSNARLPAVGQGPAASLARSLERVPPDREARVQVELLFVPKTELVKAAEEEVRLPSKAGRVAPEVHGTPGAGDSLKNELQKNVRGVPGAMGVRREYILPPADPAGRAAKIAEIAAEMERALSAGREGYDTRTSVSIQTGGGRGGMPGTGVRDIPRHGNVSYQPRAVGNDMGLWVMGSSWMELVLEGLETGESLSASYGKGVIEAAAGLGRLIAGEPDEAMEKFMEAGSSGERELALLGAVAAWIEKGDEARAAELCSEVLKLNPQSRVAADNLKWLKTPSKVTAKESRE